MNYNNLKENDSGGAMEGGGSTVILGRAHWMAPINSTLRCPSQASGVTALMVIWATILLSTAIHKYRILSQEVITVQDQRTT
jgi:hypothetical protein